MTAEEVVAHGLVAVIRADSAAAAVARGRLLAQAGVKVLEVAFTLADAASAIEELAQALPGVAVGAGTVLTAGQAEAAVRAGASFLISPHYSPEVGRAARALGAAYLPACFTPTELATLLEAGYRVVKLFPAVAYGPGGMKALGDPFPQARFVPTGGVRPDQVAEWLGAGAVAVGMGAALTQAPDPQAAVAAVLEQVARARAARGQGA